jgi:hypothetical protein
LTILDRFGRTAGVRSRVIPRSLVLVGATALTLAPVAIAAPASASAKSAASISLFSGDTKFTADGHNWVLEITAFSGATTIGLETTNEQDGWTFLTSASTFTVNAKTGHATFRSHNTLAPIAFINLSFTATKHKKQACVSGSETVFTGHISGSVTFIASSKVKFKSAHVDFSSPFVTVDKACIAKIPGGGNTCFGGFWNAGSAVTASGNTPGLGSAPLTASISKTVVLKKPAGATMTGIVFGSQSKPIFNSKKRTLSVKASGGLIAGSALLTSKEPPDVQTSTCVSKGKKFKATDADYFAKYASPTGHQFVGQSVILGKLTAAKTGSAIFDIITFKKAGGFGGSSSRASTA